jgi:hypothetical protein
MGTTASAGVVAKYDPKVIVAENGLENPAPSPAAIVAADGISRLRPKQTLQRSRAAIERAKDRVDRKPAETSGGRGQGAIQTEESIAERAARRQAVVMPILTRKRWKQGAWPQRPGWARTPCTSTWMEPGTRSPARTEMPSPKRLI